VTRLVLTNAIYFKGKWTKQLNTANTAPVVFWLNGTETVMVPMIVSDGKGIQFSK
jgi:serine protease inhibitor